MKKTKLLKSLLVAAGLCVGASAWAQTTTLLEYGTSDVAWSATNLAEWTAGGTPTISDDGTYVGITGGNGSYATSKTISPTANAIINVSAVWRGRSNTGRAFSAGNGSYFRFGNIIVAQNDQDKKHGYGFTGLDNIGSVTTFEAGSYRIDIDNCTWLLIEAEINTASNTLTSFTIKSEDGTKTYASASNVVLSDADYTTVAFGYRKSGSVSLANAEQLKSVKVTQTTQTVETANYTVKYVCDGTEVKTAETRTGVVGQDIALNSSDTENFYANDKKYIYVSSDVEGKTVAEDVVVTVTFREAETYAWTASSNVGTYTISGVAFEGDKASVTYPLYVLVDGKLWKKDATNSTFAQSFEVTENNQALTLEYAETDIDNVVFYAEMEDVEGMGVVNSGNAAARSSQRAAGYSASGSTKFATLPAGKYQVYARFYSPTSAGGKYNFYTGNRNIWYKETSNANATDGNTEVLLAQDENELLLGQCGSTAAVDFVYIVKTADLTDDEIAETQAADAIAEAKAELQAVIDEAKAIDTTDKNGAEELATAITAAETAYAAEDATVESLTAAQTALEEAIVAFEDANTLKYYLVGDMNDWKASADYLLTLNEEASTTEYYINGLQLTTSQGFKVIGVLGETTTWYPDGDNNDYYVSADGTYDVYFRPNGDGDDSWHYNCIYAALKPTYTVAGSSDVIFGSAWDVTKTDNDMTENEDGTYRITYTGVELSANVEYKVVKNHSWGEEWPASNRPIGISMAGKYDLTIHFDPSNCSVWETMAIYKDITDAGYATYCSPYDLNFEDTGVKAYIATLNGSNVTFEEVTSAPANTGLLLKADKGSYPIAMETSSTNTEGNALIGVLENTHVGKGAFVLMSGDSGVGFYKTNNDEGFTVGANTAYIAATASARTFIGFDFDDNTTTAIEGVATVQMNSGEIYNLQGQRVSAAKKGLYIINGKKVLVK